MKKKNRLMLLFALGILLISLSSVSAIIKDYDSDEKVVTLSNSFLFFKTSEIGKIQLLTPLDYKVASGYSKVFELKVINYESYDKFISEIKTYNVYENMAEEKREIDLKIKKVITEKEDIFNYTEKEVLENGTKIYEKKKVGEKEVQKIVWEDLSENNFIGNDLIIGGFSNVKIGDKIEWIPKIAGKRIKEWATWTESLDVNLELYYKLEESSGSVLDVTGVNNGTNNGATTGVTGKVNNAYDFERTDGDYIEIPDDASLDFTTTMSISMWFKLESVNSQNLISKQNGNGYYIFQNGGTQYIEAGLDGVGTATTSTTYSDTNWHHIVITYNSAGGTNNLRIYMDGVSNANSTISGTIPTNSNPLYIGRYATSDANHFDGIIDEVGLWSRVLSKEEVEQLYNGGEGITYYGEFPEIIINSPVSSNYTEDKEIEFNITAWDGTNLSEVSLYLNGVLNQTNSSGLNNSNYFFNLSLDEGEWEIYGKATDNESNQKESNYVYIIIDKTSPLIENVSINNSGEIFGFPQVFSISSNITDPHLESCWYNTDYNSSNITFTCGNNITLDNIPEGNREITIFSNDTFGHVGINSSSWTIDYYTHNVTYQDSLNSSMVLNPTCEFLGVNHTGYSHSMDIHETSSRDVDCWLNGYNFFEYDLTESNQTNQSVSVVPVYLNLTFDAETNATITWLGGSLDYENVTNITISIREIEGEGEIQVSFNEDTQLYSFYNDGNTPINASLHIEDVDFDQPVKVLASSQEVANALVILYKDNKVTYSAFTDISGIAHVLVNDGTTYEVHATKEGYEEYSKLVYIPTSNTETIIVNLVSEEETAGDYYFSSSCLNTIGTEQNCTFSVRSYKDTTINFNYTWNGSSYSVSKNDSEANLTLLANEETTPISVTASVNPTRSYSISWDDLGDRAVQLDFDADDIRGEGAGVITLFYLIVLIIGILLMVSINNMPKMQGKGIWGMVVWLGAIALKFPLLWFIITPTLIYAIFKTFWGEDD